MPNFEQVRDVAQREWSAERRAAALSQHYQSLFAGYSVEVEDGSRAGAPQ